MGHHTKTFGEEEKKIKKRAENTILGHTVFSTDLVSPNFTLYARRLMEHNIFFGFN